MPKMQIREYEPFDYGKKTFKKKQKIKYKEINSNEKTLGNVATYNTNAVSTFSPEKEKILHSNPFLYDGSLGEEIMSIEDFFYKKKKMDMQFGDIINHPNFSYNKRKKLTREAFKEWSKDYDKRKKENITKTDTSLDIIGDIAYERFTKRGKLLIYVMFFILLFTVYVPGLVWDKIKINPLFYNIYGKMFEYYKTYPFIYYIVCVFVYLNIFLICYIPIHNGISLEFSKQHRFAKETLEATKNKMDYSFEKKHKEAYRYYMKRINRKRKMIIPYPVDKVMPGKISISTFESVTTAITNKAANVKKIKSLFQTGKSGLTVMCYISVILIYAFMAYIYISDLFL